MVTGQERLDFRDDFLEIHAHLGFGEEGFNQPDALIRALTGGKTSVLLCLRSAGPAIALCFEPALGCAEFYKAL